MVSGLPYTTIHYHTIHYTTSSVYMCVCLFALPRANHVEVRHYAPAPLWALVLLIVPLLRILAVTRDIPLIAWPSTVGICYKSLAIALLAIGDCASPMTLWTFIFSHGEPIFEFWDLACCATQFTLGHDFLLFCLAALSSKPIHHVKVSASYGWAYIGPCLFYISYRTPIFITTGYPC
jgi:hypothetical protein